MIVSAIIERLKMRDVAVVTLSSDNGYSGLGLPFRLQAVKALYVGDVMADIRAAINALAVDKDEGRRIWQREWERICGVFDGSVRKSFYRQLEQSVRELGKIELMQPIAQAKVIGLVGEIFVRRDYFCLSGIMEKLADKGFVVISSPVTEWLRYVDFLRDRKMLISTYSLAGAFEAAASDFLQNHHEKKIKRMLARSGLYEYELIDIKSSINHSTHYFPWWFTGEPGLSSGTMHANLIDKWCGVVNAGPFGCMQSRMTEAVTTPELTIDGKERASRNAGVVKDFSPYRKNIDVLPFFSVEFDGNPFSQILETRLETFVLQANRLYDLMRQEAGERLF
jgi:predicted nucleotide-binding protein (sugar kinase/HSP70/actin superfamily)